MKWVLTRAKILKNYSFAESERYDLKLFIEYTKGFWFFKRKIQFIVWRENRYYKRHYPNRYMDRSSSTNVQCSYLFDDGGYLQSEFRILLNSHFEKMYRSRQLIQDKKIRANTIKELL